MSCFVEFTPRRKAAEEGCPRPCWLPEDNKEFERLILGYLCIDHIDTGYFDLEIDLPVTYVLADLLAIYLFARWELTQGSETYRRAKDCTNMRKLELDLSATKRVFGVSRQLPTTKANQLLSADEYLLGSFAGKVSNAVNGHGVSQGAIAA
jgi:hypothetical protein